MAGLRPQANEQVTPRAARIHAVPSGAPAPQGMLLLADELAGGWHNMHRYGGDGTQFWLMAWDGKPYAVERIGRSSFKLPRLLVSVVGGLQPDKLRKVFESQDGFYARPLYAWLDMPPHRALSDAVASDEEMVNVFDRMDRLARKESNPIRLNDKALAEFENLRKHPLISSGTCREDFAVRRKIVER